MFETELNHGNDAKVTQLQASLYYADDDAKTGQTNRLEIFKDSAWVELMAPIHADLCMQERFLINQCELRVELYRIEKVSVSLIRLSLNINTSWKLNRCLYLSKKLKFLIALVWL